MARLIHSFLALLAACLTVGCNSAPTADGDYIWQESEYLEPEHIHLENFQGWSKTPAGSKKELRYEIKEGKLVLYAKDNPTPIGYFLIQKDGLFWIEKEFLLPRQK
jgi:hypothetical protein